MKRQLPELEGATAWFWTSGADGVLRIQHCAACGHWQHPPLAACPKCHDRAPAPRAVSGLGRVKTFTVNAQAWQGGAADPFVFAAIELDEQAELYVLSNVMVEPAQVHSGMRVQVVFEQHEDVWLPLFRPLEAAHG